MTAALLRWKENKLWDKAHKTKQLICLVRYGLLITAQVLPSFRRLDIRPQVSLTSWRHLLPPWRSDSCLSVNSVWHRFHLKALQSALTSGSPSNPQQHGEPAVERAESVSHFSNQTQRLDAAGLITDRWRESPSWVSCSLCRGRLMRNAEKCQTLFAFCVPTRLRTPATRTGCTQSSGAEASTYRIYMMCGLKGRGIHIHYCGKSWRTASASRLMNAAVPRSPPESVCGSVFKRQRHFSLQPELAFLMLRWFRYCIFQDESLLSSFTQT